MADLSRGALRIVETASLLAQSAGLLRGGEGNGDSGLFHLTSLLAVPAAPAQTLLPAHWQLARPDTREHSWGA